MTARTKKPGGFLRKVRQNWIMLLMVLPAVLYFGGIFISVHLDNLSDQTLIRHADYVKHICIAHSLCNNKWSCDFLNHSCAH